MAACGKLRLFLSESVVFTGGEFTDNSSPRVVSVSIESVVAGIKQLTILFFVDFIDAGKIEWVRFQITSTSRSFPVCRAVEDR